MDDENFNAHREKLEDIQRFIKDNDAHFTQDKIDFRRSKHYASGDGWWASLGRAWGESRANAHIDAIAPVVDSTCNTFMRNPFVFKNIPEELSNRINEVLNECLRETCHDGMSFVYIYHDDENRLNIRRISNLHIMYTETECVVIDKIRVEESNVSVSSIWNNLDALKRASNEIPIITHFLLKDGVVEITKIKGEEIVAETSVALPHLPIIPIRGKQVMMSDNDVYYRGYYYTLRDVLSAINANLSVSLERMISRDPVLLAEESLGDSEYIKQWEENGTRNFYVYQALKEIDSATGETATLPAPILNPQVNDIQKLETLRTSLFALVDRITGSNYLSESKGAETATQVLLRNQNKEDALSQILLNLTHAAQRIAIVLMAYFRELGVEIAEVITVKDNVTEGIKNTNSIQLLLAIKDLPINLQMSVLSVYDAPKQIIEAVALEAQKQNDPVKQELEQQNQQLQHQIQMMQAENKMAEATHAAAMIEAQQRYSTKMAELEIEKEIKMAQIAIDKAKLELEWAKLGQKDKVDTVELMQTAEIEGAKIAKELADPQP